MVTYSPGHHFWAVVLLLEHGHVYHLDSIDCRERAVVLCDFGVGSQVEDLADTKGS